MEEGRIGNVCAVESGVDVGLFEVGDEPIELLFVDEVEGFGFELGLEVAAKVAEEIKSIAFGG